MPNYTFPDSPPDKLFDRVVEQAKAAEESGFALVTVMDHLYQIGGVGPEEAPMLEAYSVLSALARETSRVTLGTLVTGVTYRNPAFLAKTVTTLDIDLRRPRAAWAGRGMERGRAHRLRLHVPAREGAHGSAGRCPRHREGHVRAGSVHLRGSLVARREDHQLPAAGPTGRAEDHGRRRRRAAHAAHCGQVRRHDSLVPDRDGRAEAQERRAARLLRGDRTQSGRGPADNGSTRGAARQRRQIATRSWSESRSSAARH